MSTLVVVDLFGRRDSVRGAERWRWYLYRQGAKNAKDAKKKTRPAQALRFLGVLGVLGVLRALAVKLAARRPNLQ